MVEAFISGWKRSFDYVGRSSRPDFWWFVLANVIVSVVLAILTNAVSQLTALYTLYSIAVIVPSLPLTIRRLRDMGKGWGWIFIGLIPIIGFIWQIVLLVQPSIPA
jgi:uncharacterized membrane protein YhaH (DUF805 family)